MKTTVKNRCVIVGIFDNAQHLDKAVERLAAAGFEDTVYDQAIVAQGPGSAGAIPVGPVLAPGAVPAQISANVELDLPTIVRSFQSHLAHYHLPDEVIDAYATTFYHKGKSVLVKTDAESAEQVMQILRECGASRVNRHD